MRAHDKSDGWNPPPTQPTPGTDLRQATDRRASWRGGRRNTDWLDRPQGGWQHVEQRLSPWPDWIAKLTLQRPSTRRQWGQS